jgi:Undecaprenyl-phosphate glucose phosphotransferase
MIEIAKPTDHSGVLIPFHREVTPDALLPPEVEPSGSILSLTARCVDVISILAATFAMFVAESQPLSHHDGLVIGVTDVTGMLLLFALSSVPPLMFRGISSLFLQQLGSRGLPLLLAALLQGTIRHLFGWDYRICAISATAWFALTIVSLMSARATAWAIVNTPAMRRRMLKRFVIIGSDLRAVRLAERLRRSSANVEVIKVLEHGIDQSVREALDDLADQSHQTKLYGIIIALPPAVGDEPRVLEFGRHLRGAMSDVFVMPYLVHAPGMVLPMQSVAGVPMMVMQRRPLDEGQKLRKRALDLVLSLVAFVLLAPVFAIVALAIKLDSPGPVFFLQPRRGFNNRQFMVFKFRSMYADATDRMAARQTSRDDPRVTRVGKWLRRLSIDELPQLLNVLRGEMSLVGPRPHAPHTSVEGKLLNDAISDYALRYRVKPGITGWAQVNGARGELVTTEDLRRRLAFDFDYIQRWSITFDIKIMVLTALREIVSRHAF